MSLEGTIRDLGLQEVGQLLSLSRKTGTLRVWSVLRGARAWIRFVDGAIVDAGEGHVPADGAWSEAATAGNRPEVEEAALAVLAWREGHFAFTGHAAKGDGVAVSASRVCIPTDAMLVESAHREDAWRALSDRIASAEAVPSFVDVEPKSLPLLRLQPQEWEVLTRVDGERTVRTLARLMQRDLLEIAAIVHGLIGAGLLVVADPNLRRPIASSGPTPRDLTPTDPAPALPPQTASDPELWIPGRAEMAVFAEGDAEDSLFDPLRAGMLTPHGSPRVPPSPTPLPPHASMPAGVPDRAASGVTLRANGHVASKGAEPSLIGGAAVAGTADPVPDEQLRREGDDAARRGDFERALSCWTRYLRTPHGTEEADRVREAIGLAARLQALLHPTA